MGHSAFAASAMLALTVAVMLQIARDSWYPRDARDNARILYVRSGGAASRLALEYRALAADVYWIRAIQHYGGDRLTRSRIQARYDLLYPLLDLATTLDPYFKIAYRFGALFLSEPPPGGPGRPDQAIALLRKAIVAQPGAWQYYHDIAFVYYWHLHDYQGAATWFSRAAALPNAPNWLTPIAASMLTRGQDRGAARFLWQQILKSDQEWLRKSAERALVQLYALDQMDELDALLTRFPPLAGEPQSWEALLRRRILVRRPVDPAGAPYLINPETGRVTISPQSSLFPMPDETRNPKP
jgi:tetratricopeptide (TPR) repeat protein